jgi:hypothetical protein
MGPQASLVTHGGRRCSPADPALLRGVLRRPGTEAFGRRRWLVLVGSPARLFASRPGPIVTSYAARRHAVKDKF